MQCTFFQQFSTTELGVATFPKIFENICIIESFSFMTRRFVGFKTNRLNLSIILIDMSSFDKDHILIKK
jgi:hypothetical protein